MQTSDYLIHALFYERNYGTDQFLERKSEALFQRPGKESFIEVHSEWPDPALVLDGKRVSNCSSVHTSLPDESHCSSLHEDPPPTYVHPGLLRQEVLDLEDLQRIEMVSALMAALSICANIHGYEGNQAPFPRMVSESSMPSDGIPF